MPFHVVEFLQDNSLAVVPSAWLTNKDTYCFWPPFPTAGARMKRAILDAVQPGDDWDVLEVRSLTVTGIFFICIRLILNYYCATYTFCTSISNVTLCFQNFKYLPVK